MAGKKRGSKLKGKPGRPPAPLDRVIGVEADEGGIYRAVYCRGGKLCRPRRRTREAAEELLAAKAREMGLAPPLEAEEAVELEELTPAELEAAVDPRRWLGLVYRGSKTLERTLASDKTDTTEKMRAFNALTRAATSATQLIKRLSTAGGVEEGGRDPTTEELVAEVAALVASESGGLRRLEVVDVPPPAKAKAKGGGDGRKAPN